MLMLVGDIETMRDADKVLRYTHNCVARDAAGAAHELPMNQGDERKRQARGPVPMHLNLHEPFNQSDMIARQLPSRR